MASKTACLSRKGYIAFGHQNIQEERSGHHLVGYKAMNQNTISPAAHEMKLHHASSRRAIEGKHKRVSIAHRTGVRNACDSHTRE